MKLLFASLLTAAAACAGTVAKADMPRASQTAFIEEFDNTLAPLQFVKFCMNYSGDCEANTAARALPSADQAMDVLRQVNASVNEAISPARKSTDPVTAHWTLWPSAGDCNDYAVTKRHQLLSMGWPQEALRLAVVLVDGGQGHLVLVVRLPDGDVVLDNLSSTIRPWNALDYQWISMQSGSNPRFWVAIGHRGQQLQANRLAALAKSPLN